MTTVHGVRPTAEELNKLMVRAVAVTGRAEHVTPRRRRYGQPGWPAPAAGTSRRAERLLTLVQQAALDGAREIVLDDGAINSLAADSGDEVRPVSHVDVCVDVRAPTTAALAEGAFTLAVTGIGRTGIATSGRFLDVVSDDDRRRMVRPYGEFPVGVNGALPAQMSFPSQHPRVENVARVPLVLPEVISMGEHRDGVQGRIPVHDLAVTADQDRMYVVSLSRQLVVEPVLTHAAARHTMPADDSYADLGVPGAAVAYVGTWRDAPLEGVAAAVSAAVSRVTGADPVEDPMETGAMEKGASAPRLSVRWLREVLRQSKASTVYLISDQFGEYFLYYPMDRGEEGLTAELGDILSARDLPVHVLLSIREDAVAGLDRFRERVPHLFGNYLRLAHLSREAARAAIEGPLDQYNRLAPPDRRMSIEPGLIETLLDQVRTDHLRVAAEGAAPNVFASVPLASDDLGDIETPYLQLVLTRLWDAERAAGSSLLRQSTLDELGGAQTIVQTHLDNVMADLSPAQVDVAAAVFHRLITRSGTKIALTAEDLADWAGLPVSAVQDLLETLSAGPQRILRPVPPTVEVAGPPRYEIFHDVMGSAVLDWCRRYVA